VDGDAILDGILRSSRSAWPAALVTTREITPQLLRNRSSRDPPPANARNLLRGPPLREAVDDFGEWRSLDRWDGLGTGTSATGLGYGG
jgi:hypothetical protein